MYGTGGKTSLSKSFDIPLMPGGRIETCLVHPVNFG
jgi:hypothetical protein